MIKLASYQQAKDLSAQIPALAALRIKQLDGNDYDPDSHGHNVCLEPGDDINFVSEYGVIRL